MRPSCVTFIAGTPTSILNSGNLFTVFFLVFLAAGVLKVLKDSDEVQSASSAGIGTVKWAALLYTVFSGVNLLMLMQLSVLRGSGIEQVLPLQPANQPIEGPYEATFI